MAGAVKKIPMRMCLGCNEMKPKRELIRAVKTPDGDVLLDLTGKKSGRGAYICRDIKCFEAAKKGKKLERALKCGVPDEIYDNIAKELTSDK